MVRGNGDVVLTSADAEDWTEKVNWVALGPKSFATGQMLTRLDLFFLTLSFNSPLDLVILFPVSKRQSVP
jgi:hypothetical protein